MRRRTFSFLFRCLFSRVDRSSTFPSHPSSSTSCPFVPRVYYFANPRVARDDNRAVWTRPHLHLGLERFLVCMPSFYLRPFERRLAIREAETTRGILVDTFIESVAFSQSYSYSLRSTLDHCNGNSSRQRPHRRCRSIRTRRSGTQKVRLTIHQRSSSCLKPPKTTLQRIIAEDNQGVRKALALVCL